MYNFSSLIIFQSVLLDIITRNGRWIVTKHSADDVFYLTISIILIVVIIFVITYLNRVGKRNKEAQYTPSPFFQALGKIGDVYSYIVGGGCLIGMIIVPIVLIVLLFTGNGKTKLPQRDLGERKDSTLVLSIISDTDFKQSHIADKSEFKDNDTIFYYERIIFQNITGKELTEYLVKYEPNGNHTLEVIKVIKPNQYFKSNIIVPFEKPKKNIDFKRSPKYINWKGRTRGGELQSEYKLFVDYSEYVNCLPFKRVNR